MQCSSTLYSDILEDTFKKKDKKSKNKEYTKGKEKKRDYSKERERKRNYE